jgi:hypothetical protein
VLARADQLDQTTPPATITVPYQFIAKMYTEALGRIPDLSGWQTYVSYFQAHPCSATSLVAVGVAFYESSEFTSLLTDNPARLVALYRGAWNQEADNTSTFNTYLGLLNNGTYTWAQVVNTFFNPNAGPFAATVPYICGVDSYGQSGVYHFGAGWPIAIPTSSTGHFAGGTGAQLQALLNAAQPNGTVTLEQKALVNVSQQLSIPAGVTLTTVGPPTRNQYALMGRLVRTANFSGNSGVGCTPGQGCPLVILNNGSKLLNVWVDGELPNLVYAGSDINIQIEGGASATIKNSRISNSAGFSNVQAFGPCTSTVLSSNMITAYSSDHYIPAGPTARTNDGFTISCEHTTIDSNSVVDTTDVGIDIFFADPAVQQSQVTNNMVLSSGNSMWGGIATANGCNPAPCTHDFTGTLFSGNTLWTSATSHMDQGISDGGRAWCCNAMATGAKFLNNTSGAQSIRSQTGLAVSGMLNTTVSGNTFNWTSSPGGCPHFKVGASVSAGLASGTIQTYTDVLIDNCLHH